MKDKLLKALSEVYDPDFKKDIVSLNMVQNMNVSEDKITFDVVLTTPACPLQEVIRKDCEAAVEKYFGNLEVQIHFRSDVTTSRSKETLLPQVKNVIAVSSGKGGVGKSTIAANLSVALAKLGAKVGLIDADIFGPSIPVMFNCEFEQPRIIQVEGKNKIIPIQQYGVKLISIGLLTNSENAVVWRGPMASSALRQFIGDVQWEALDYLIIDLPPGTSDIHLTLVQTLPVTGAIIVTTPQKIAIMDAQKGLAMFHQKSINVPVLGIIENMAWFAPPDNPESKHFLFGTGGAKKMSEKYKVPLLGEIPILQTIREGGDQGYPLALNEDVHANNTFSNLAKQVAQQVAIRNMNHPETEKVNVAV